MPEEFVKQREGCRNEQGAACDAIKRVSGLELQHLTTLPGKMREHNVRSCYCHGTAIPSLLCVWGGSLCHKNNGDKMRLGLCCVEEHFQAL